MSEAMQSDGNELLFFIKKTLRVSLLWSRSVLISEMENLIRVFSLKGSQPKTKMMTILLMVQIGIRMISHGKIMVR